MDWDKLHKLLIIADLSNQWPQLHHVRDKAMAELTSMNLKEEKPEKEEAKPLEDEPETPPEDVRRRET